MANRITPRIRKIQEERALKRQQKFYNELMEKAERKQKQMEKRAQLRRMTASFLYGK